MVSNIGMQYQPMQAYNTYRQIPPVKQKLEPVKPQPKEEKKGLSIGTKIAIAIGCVTALIFADYFFRGKNSTSKAVINKIETLLKNKKVQEQCKKSNIETDINKIKEKSYEKQLEFLEDLLDIVIQVV